MEVVLKISDNVMSLTERNMFFSCCTQLQLTLIKWCTCKKTLYACSSKKYQKHTNTKKGEFPPKTWLVTPAAAYGNYMTTVTTTTRNQRLMLHAKAVQPSISRPHTKFQHQTGYSNLYIQHITAYKTTSCFQTRA